MEETTKGEDGQPEFSFFDNQPRHVKILFDLIPFLTYTFAFVIAYFCFADIANLGSELKSIYSYIVEAFLAMFSGEGVKSEFANATKAICEGKNVIAFGFLILTLLMILTIPISSFLSQAMSKKSTVLKWLVTIYFLGYLWILLWKIPQFVFSFFSMRQSIIYFLSFLVGIYLSGAVFYFLSLFVVKNISTRRVINDFKSNAKSNG